MAFNTNTLFEKLCADLDLPGLFDRPQTGEEEKCRSWKNVYQDERCTHKPRKTKKPNWDTECEELLKHFEAMESVVLTDPELHGDIKKLILRNSCGHHGGKEADRFELWVEQLILDMSEKSEDSRNDAQGFEEVKAEVVATGKSESFKGQSSIVSVVAVDKPDSDRSSSPPSKQHAPGADDETVKAVAEEISALKIGEGDAEKHSQRDGFADGAASDRIVGTDTIRNIIDVGVCDFGRNGSFRNDSQVYNEMHKRLTEKDMEEGVVYILQKNGYNDLFKVGWTKATAAERQGQRNNCYGIDTTVIYESQTLFAFARRAESISHKMLHRTRLQVTRCCHCDGKHREWFRGSEVEVRQAVSVAEMLMRIPGYTMQEGVMKLSPEAYVMIQGMSRLRMDELETSLRASSSQGSVASQNTVVASNEASPKQLENPLASQVSASVRDPDAPIPSVEPRDAGLDASVPPVEPRDSGKLPPPSWFPKEATSPKSMGGKMGRFAKGAMQKWESRSRTSTPEAESQRNGNRRRVSSNNLLTMATAGKDATEKAIEQFFRDFKDEYSKQANYGN